ncbi:hypothetical protein I7I53_00533 [Histoplasma capsulatum var. duboisii H88]|uniref:Uncharacterized protein n=1 Tax=Ajellomyces capsulatus (strain H88) TaxID=544711 RepID=A0A8A1LLH3_AJEC8|nr:hypothetical protein I7I53_00533 [Histoplasma capsulatum var. duboisii H88]
MVFLGFDGACLCLARSLSRNPARCGLIHHQSEGHHLPCIGVHPMRNCCIRSRFIWRPAFRAR